MQSKNPERYLLIGRSTEFKTLWTISGLTDSYLFDFQDILNPYRVIFLKDFEEIFERAQERDYEVIFVDDPLEALGAYQALEEAPDIELHSPFENTVNGLVPFQVKAYNYLKGLNGGLLLASTGTGKTALAIALSKHFYEEVDYIVFIAKSHNKVNVQRSFKEFADLDSIVIEGSISKRKEQYQKVLDGEYKVVIANYEKLKLVPDRPYWKDIFSKRLTVYWDEMPNKLKHRNTQLYRSIRYLIYEKEFGKFRSPDIHQYMLTATPIEHSPLDIFNTLRLIDPKALGNVLDFEQDHVRSYNLFSNKPQTWKNLDKLGLKTAYLTYQIDKNDPEIASQFPEVITQDIELDWNESDRKIYDLLQQKAIGIFAQQGMDSVFPLIMLMQLMCDLPSAINASAQSYQTWEDEIHQGLWSPQRGSEYASIFTSAVGQLRDDRHTKIDYLREILTEQYSDSKAIIFTTFGNLVMPHLAQFLEKWNVSSVMYRGTNKEKQAAQDQFKNDPSIRVFLSSDAGSDSISLEEANLVVHFDMPYAHATRIQRQNRCHRITSTHKSVRFISLTMASSVEQRKMAIMNRKAKYQENVFEGTQETLNQEALRWILTGGDS